ncbi:MAG TPA: hypothetical protein VNM39_17285 [Verrucomicrobiae bacterium]|nr:hypothetical protein [Verrucomicrobiae bacterium]
MTITTIERIGNITIFTNPKNDCVGVIEREVPGVEYFHTIRGAREYAMERADLVDGLGAIVTRH